jgi:hypothetical protein
MKIDLKTRKEEHKSRKAGRWRGEPVLLFAIVVSSWFGHLSREGIIAANAQEPAKTGGQAQQPRSSDQGETVRIGSEEVLLDVVARDRKGRPVTDLKADEIEVYEDGVKQRINSFRRVEKTDLTEGAGASNNAGDDGL